MKNKNTIKIRRNWAINPIERIKQSKKVYNRRFSKKEIQEILKREDF